MSNQNQQNQNEGRNKDGRNVPGNNFKDRERAREGQKGGEQFHGGKERE